MARRVIVAAALAALAIVPSAGAATSVTLVFTSYTTITKTHDIAPRGKANKGDSIEFKDLLVAARNQLGKKKGRPVAYDAGTVSYTSATTQRIDGVMTFPGVGTVTFRGAMRSMKDGTTRVRVVQGTGSFKGAKGTLIIGKGDQKAPNTYVLELPRPIPLPGSA